MSTGSTYSYENEDFVIEDGIIKGKYETAYYPDYKSFGALILDRLRADPQFVGQIDALTERRETFAEMAMKSIKCAMWMRELKIEPGDVIGICTHNQPDMYVPCFASTFVGAVFNAWWDVGLTKEIGKHFVTLTRPKIIFTDRASASIVRDAVNEATDAPTKIILIGTEATSEFQSLDQIIESQGTRRDEEEEEEEEEKERNTFVIDDFVCTEISSPEDPAAILYTSGSTGLPKGALFSNIALLQNISHFSTVGETKRAASLIFSPLSWLSGVYTMFRGVITPDTRIVCPEFTEERCLETIEKFKVDWLVLGVSAAFRLQKYHSVSKYDVSSLKKFYVGGAALKEEMQKALAALFPKAFVSQAYGSTEIGKVGVQQTSDSMVGSCGRVVKNVSLKIVDPNTGRAMNPNETGEACFKHPYAMTGYYRNPVETSRSIDSQGWLHTGDLMYYDREGNVYFVDRMKEMIKYRGNHVSPTMIEQLLQEHPAIREVAVVSIPHDLDEEHPIAFVSTNPTAKITEDQVQKIVDDVLPDCMRLRGGVKFMKELPHTSSDKIARRSLKELARSFAC